MNLELLASFRGPGSEGLTESLTEAGTASDFVASRQGDVFHALAIDPGTQGVLHEALIDLCLGVLVKVDS